MRGSMIAWLSLCATVQAGTLNIVATGDSLLTAIAPTRLTFALKSQGVSGIATSIASGGATAPIYVGDQLDIRHMPEPAFHNQAEEAINGPVYGFGAPWTYGSVIEPNPEPDVVVIMLGTNDSLQHAAGNVTAWPTYQEKMVGVYQYLATAVTPGGRHPELFIATPLPILDNPTNPVFAAADAFLDSTLIPWIKSQIDALQTQGYAVHLIDVNADARQQANWQSWYSDDGVNPGYVHLWGAGQVGYDWLTDEIINCVLDAHAGDANLDGVADGLDYTTWADHFQQSGNWSQGDYNHDGMVDGLDYCVWADHFSGTVEQQMAIAPAYLVPEPSGLALAGITLAGSVAIAIRRVSRPDTRAFFVRFVLVATRHLASLFAWGRN